MQQTQKEFAINKEFKMYPKVTKNLSLKGY